MCDAADMNGQSSPARTTTLRPAVPAVVVVSVVAWAVLLVAVWQGWLGEEAGRGGLFCEATRSGWIKQPVNTWSNIGFTIAALAIARRIDTAPVRSEMRAPMVFFSLVVASLGPGSAAMHATETAVGGHLDLLSMYLLASFAAAYAVVRNGRLGPQGGGWLFAALVVLCEVVGAVPVTLPVLMHPGNAAFAVLLITSLVLEAGLIRRGETEARWGLASVGTLLVSFAIWNLAKDGSALCHPYSMLQGHGAWHVLDATAAYFLARHYLAPRENPGG